MPHLLSVDEKYSHEKVEHRHQDLGDMPPDVAAHSAGVHRECGSARSRHSESPSQLLQQPRAGERGRKRQAEIDVACVREIKRTICMMTRERRQADNIGEHKMRHSKRNITCAVSAAGVLARGQVAHKNEMCPVALPKLTQPQPWRRAPSPACCRRTWFPGDSGFRRWTIPSLCGPSDAAQS